MWIRSLEALGGCMSCCLFCTQCTKTCGEASRLRKVFCVDENEQLQSSGHCDASKRPPEVESCGLPPCEYIWITGEWSEVSPHPLHQAMLSSPQHSPPLNSPC